DGFAKCHGKRIDRWREWAGLSEGCYVLRSNVTEWSPEALWRAYMQLTEAEAAFRIQKTDLQLRPIWHQKQERVEAHILVCFLTFVLWKTLAQLCQRAGLGNVPRKVFQGDVRQLLEYFPRFVAQPSALAELRQRLPQHKGQKAHQDVRFDPLLFLVPDRSQLQIRLLDAERGLGLRQLHVGTPEFFRAPVRHVAAQHITTLAEACPLLPAIDSFPLTLRKAICIGIDLDLKRSRCPRVL